ncbi:MAG: hypothetical protein Q9196_003763 [Gyalolechia fulgens]
MKPISGLQQYKDLVYGKGLAWTRAIQRLPKEQQPEEDLSLPESWKVMIKDATPELINVVDGEALWRIPHCARTDVWGTHLPEAISCLMEQLENQRWRYFAVGTGRNVGDVFNKGPLTREEIAQIQRGRFPRSLELYGVPGPGVCVPQHQAGSGRTGPSRAGADPHLGYGHGDAPHPPRQSRGPRQQHGPRPPRLPQPPRRQRGPHPPPGPSARRHGTTPGADSLSTLSSGTETTSNSSSYEESGRRRRRRAQQALMLGAAVLALGEDGGGDRPSRRGRGGPPARGLGRRGPPPGREG